MRRLHWLAVLLFALTAPASAELTLPQRVTVLDEGTERGQVSELNFTGTGVTATVSGVRATVDVSGGGGGGGLIGQIAAQTYLSLAKTNIGTAYVDIYAAAFDQENMAKIDCANVTDVRIVYLWDYVGVGSQQVRWVDAANNANVLREEPAFTADKDPGDSGWFAKPAWCTGDVMIEWQGKSTTGTDDPIAKGYKILVR